MFCVVIGVPIYFVGEIDPVTILYLYNALLLFAATFILFALFATKMVHLVIPSKKRGRKKADEAGDFSRAKFTEIVQPNESTLQAYEGELAVRTERKLLPDMAPWKMKRVIVIPSRKLLLLIEVRINTSRLLKGYFSNVLIFQFHDQCVAFLTKLFTMICTPSPSPENMIRMAIPRANRNALIRMNTCSVSLDRIGTMTFCSR